MLEVINNIDKRLVDELKKEIREKSKVKVAASCFSIYAFAALKKELENVDELQFIFTIPTFTEDKVTDKIKREKREFFIPKQLRENSLYGTEFEIKLRNQLTQKAVARECADWIRAKAKFKSNTSGAGMPNYIGVQNNNADTIFMGVNGLTTAELGIEQGNVLFQAITKFDDTMYTKQLFAQFDEVWRDIGKVENVTEKILNYIESAYNENAPDFIYFYVLYNIFSEFLNDLSEDYLPNERTGFKNSLIWDKLYNFQRDGVIAILNKLEKYNGCILADSVGLGKTFTTLSVMQYYSAKNKSILVLCPKRLSDNWKQFQGNKLSNIFYEDKIRFDVHYHTDLGRRSAELAAINWGNFDLVVIDESHNFKNANPVRGKETRYDFLMNQIMKEGIKTKVLMLSATPVNNRYNDLKNQLALAYSGDYKAFNDQLETSKGVQEIFRQAQRVFNDWSKLPSEKRKNTDLVEKLDMDFRTLLDSVTIARSRRNITKFYDTKDIGNFPKRKTPISVNCDLTDIKGAIEYRNIYQKLKELTLSVYAPFTNVLESKKSEYEDKYDIVSSGIGLVSKAKNRDSGIKRLMTVNLLKRLESSCEAFRLTMHGMLATNESTLKRIDRYLQTGEDFMFTKTVFDYEAIDPDEDGGFELMPTGEGKEIQFRMKDIDCQTWKREIEGDIAVLKYLIDEFKVITPEHDTKLNKLKELITQKIETPINSGNRKFLIFSASADTANYLYANISKWAKEKFGLETAKVEGGESDNKCTFENCSKKTDMLLTMFSPKSKERDKNFNWIVNYSKSLKDPSLKWSHKVNKKEYDDCFKDIDILIGTDCISEGQNLQDCDMCINYDIHWNPVRIVQRFGRIDRIGSKNDYIQLITFWPNVNLDEYIKLNSKVESRMAIVDNTTGAEDNLLTEDQVEYEYRAMQIKKLQNGELQDLEDVDGSITLTDLGLSDFRIDVANGIKKYGEPTNAPKGMHAVINENLERGIEKGVIFILKNNSQDIKTKSQNQLKNYYLVYINDNGEIKYTHMKVKEILDILRSGCKGQDIPIAGACQVFNKETKDGYRMDKYSRLLEDSITSIIDTKAQKDIDSLFTSGGTTALTNTIKGLSDFELISFVIVK